MALRLLGVLAALFSGRSDGHWEDEGPYVVVWVELFVVWEVGLVVCERKPLLRGARGQERIRRRTLSSFTDDSVCAAVVPGFRGWGVVEGEGLLSLENWLK